MRRLILGITTSAMAVVAMALTPAFASADWFEGFESYSDGTLLDNIGGWGGWDDTSAASVSVTSAEAFTGNNSTVAGGSADAVHPFVGEFTSGMVEFDGWMLLKNADFTADTFLILNNQYSHGGTKSWSTQMNFDFETGTVIAESNGGGGTASINLDQWTNIHIMYDLDNDTQLTYYNGTLISTGTIAPGPLEIANVNLFSTGSTSYFDDLSLTAVPEPATGGCLLLGMIGTALMRRRTR